MQYNYTNEFTVEVRVSMTYADLKLIKDLLKYKSEHDKLEWRDKELLKQVEETMRSAAETIHGHYDHEVNYALKQEENNDA